MFLDTKMCIRDRPQIDRANAVSLEDFLRTQGETLIKSGREYRWKEHDSLTVRGHKWFRHSQSKGGYLIDFVMEFYGKSFPEAVQLLSLIHILYKPWIYGKIGRNNRKRSTGYKLQGKNQYCRFLLRLRLCILRSVLPDVYKRQVGRSSTP